MCDFTETSLSGVCGLGGSCEEDTCVCRRGWMKSNEFSFYSDGRNDTGDLICDVNKPLLLILYSFSFILLVGGGIAYALAAKKPSQRKRLVPFHLMTILSATFCLLKLLDVEKSITNDLTLAIMFAFMTFFAVVSTVVLMRKYIAFHYKVDLLYNPKFLKFIKILQWAAYISIAMETFAVGCFISIPTFGEGSRHKALFFTKLGFLFYSISTLFGPITAVIILNRLISVVNETITNEKSLLHMNGLRKTRNLVLTSGIQTFVFFFPAALSETWLRLEKYFVPSTVLIYSLISCIMLFWTLKLKKKKMAMKRAALGTTTPS